MNKKVVAVFLFLIYGLHGNSLYAFEEQELYGTWESYCYGGYGGDTFKSKRFLLKITKYSISVEITTYSEQWCKQILENKAYIAKYSYSNNNDHRASILAYAMKFDMADGAENNPFDRVDKRDGNSTIYFDVDGNLLKIARVFGGGRMNALLFNRLRYLGSDEK